ncbi:MAG: cytochrome c biogenesis protein ResB [Thermodesulfobacteria bacterium]|nr:cytochrome c biogenesis protein ResB [Thermodesulfobacteriota bacterium]
MTTKKKNPVWAFFASVKLALFLLFILAATSIIGTVIEQNKPFSQYVREYGQSTAELFQKLHFTDMYNSWWFLSLLGLFAINLIVCSLERIPNVIRVIKKDNLRIDPDRIAKMGIRKTVHLSCSLDEAVTSVRKFLEKKGWKTSMRVKKDSVLLFAQKGAWTRFGVYIVHLSILVILFGAVIGSPTFAKKILHKPKFAFKGSIMIPESRATDYIYSLSERGKKIDLGFAVRCNLFTIEYYSNGMPKTYLSKVSVLENGKPVVLKNGSTEWNLEVNKPLTYRGITFYQASYQPYPDFLSILRKKGTEGQETKIISGGQQIKTPFANISFGIINQKVRGEAVQQLKIWFGGDGAQPSVFWIGNGQKAIIKRPSGEYELIVKQLYATGLQVTKDPGVWFVYIGCGMMLLGLYVAFFLSHRKIYALIRADKDAGTTVLFAGSAHKNKLGFEKIFSRLVKEFEDKQQK